MLEEDTEDALIYDLSQKLRVMSIRDLSGDPVVRGLQKLDVRPITPNLEGPKDCKQMKVERYVLADQIKIKRSSPFYESSTLEHLARIARNKK